MTGNPTAHNFSDGSYGYYMPTGNWTGSMQPGWNWCSQCQGLFFGQAQPAGVCPYPVPNNPQVQWPHNNNDGITDDYNVFTLNDQV